LAPDGAVYVVGAPWFYNISAGAPSFEYAAATVARVEADGTCVPLATFTDPAYEEGGDPMDQRFYWFGPIVRGLAWHPAGHLVALTPGALHRIDPGGEATVLAEWEWDINDDTTFALYGLDAAVDPATGTVGVMDLLGGFATWSPEAGFVQHKQADLSDGWANWDAQLGVGLAWMDTDGFYGLVTDFTTGASSLSRFNLQDRAWVERLAWDDALFRPLGLDADGDHGELYASAKGGDYRTLWRLREQGELVDVFADEVEDGRTWWDIASRY
jgi:hypothetical protein